MTLELFYKCKTKGIRTLEIENEIDLQLKSQNPIYMLEKSKPAKSISNHEYSMFNL